MLRAQRGRPGAPPEGFPNRPDRDARIRTWVPRSAPQEAVLPCAKPSRRAVPTSQPSQPADADLLRCSGLRTGNAALHATEQCDGGLQSAPIAWMRRFAQRFFSRDAAAMLHRRASPDERRRNCDEAPSAGQERFLVSQTRVEPTEAIAQIVPLAPDRAVTGECHCRGS